jgi:hypothetical protein
MVIDPKLYEKVSGRSADATERLALASAAMAGRRSARGEVRSPGLSLLRGKWLASIIGSLLIMLAVVSTMISPSAMKRFWAGITGGGQRVQTGADSAPSE